MSAIFDFVKDIGKGVMSTFGGSAASSIANSLFGESQSHSMDKQYNYSVQLANHQLENQRKLNADANQRQDFLNASQYQTSVDSARRAGLNINALAGGFSPGSSTSVDSAGSAAAGSTPSPLSRFIPDMTALAQLDLMKAQTRDVNATASAKERENKNNMSRDNMFAALAPELNIYEDNGNVVFAGFTNEGDFSAYQAVKALQHDVSTYRANMEYNRLMELVNSKKANNPVVVNAMANLDVEEYRHLRAQVNNVIKDTKLKGNQAELVFSQKELTDLQRQIENDSRTSQIINKVFDPNMSWTDKLQALLTLVVIGVSHVR